MYWSIFRLMMACSRKRFQDILKHWSRFSNIKHINVAALSSFEKSLHNIGGEVFYIAYVRRILKLSAESCFPEELCEEWSYSAISEIQGARQCLLRNNDSEKFPKTTSSERDCCGKRYGPRARERLTGGTRRPVQHVSHWSIAFSLTLHALGIASAQEGHQRAPFQEAACVV